MTRKNHNFTGAGQHAADHHCRPKKVQTGGADSFNNDRRSRYSDPFNLR